MWPALGNNLGDELSNELPRSITFDMCCHCVAEELSTACIILLGEDSGELGPGFLPTPHWAHVPCANFAWNPFTVVNLSLKHNYMLSL